MTDIRKLEYEKIDSELNDGIKLLGLDNLEHLRVLGQLPDLMKLSIQNEEANPEHVVGIDSGEFDARLV